MALLLSDNSVEECKTKQLLVWKLQLEHYTL